MRCAASPECEAIFPNQFPATLRITTKTGQVFTTKVLANRGGPDNPLSADELKTRFMANASRRLNNETAAALAKAIMRFEEQWIREMLVVQFNIAAETSGRRKDASLQVISDQPQFEL